MRDDAARALRVDDELPREPVELHSVATLLPDPDDDPSSRRFGRPSPEATLALRHFERLVDESAAQAIDLDRPGRRFERADTATSASLSPAPAPVKPRRAEPATAIPRRRSGKARRDALPVEEPRVAPREAPEAETVRSPARVPLNAPGRAYGSHGRADGLTSPRVAGFQSGRRTVEITGQVQAPRRRSPSSGALAARPDRVALWAFMLAMFLVLMAVATAPA